MADSCQGPAKYDQKQIPGQYFPFIKQLTLPSLHMLTHWDLFKKNNNTPT